MSVATLDVEAVRARFSSLQRPYAFFDGPAGTQVPDEVIAAIASYLRESNANVGGAFETSRRTGELIAEARGAAAMAAELYVGTGAVRVAREGDQTGAIDHEALT